MTIISVYFLTQRIKPQQEDYVECLKKHHAVMISALKVKQNVEAKYVDELEKAVNTLLVYYPKHTHD